MSLFGDGDQSLNITIKAKDDATQTLNRVRLSVGDLAKGFVVGSLATQALTRGFGLLTGFLKDSATEFQQYNQAVAQTNAVLASTRNAAGLTAKEVIDLSKSLSDNTLYQDDMVLSAENMLLTFTNITKNIFPQTTKAVLDMSTALNQDLKSSAIQLGKALNDPLQGINALQRVGVSFTGSQQDMITAMVKSGHTMEAQRFILAELEREFGGSARSAYESASSVTKLQKSIKDLEQDVGAGLTPALNNLFASFTSTTSAEGSFSSSSYTTFLITSKLAEGAIAAAVGFTAIGTAIIDSTSYMAQFISKGTGLSYMLGLFGVNVDKTFSGVRDSVNGGLSSITDVWNTLQDKNEAVLASWGDMSKGAQELGKVGPAAYQATAAEAAAAEKKIRAAQQAIADTKKSLEDLKKSLKDDDRDAARAFVSQEQKVSDIRKQLTTEEDPDKRAELQRQLKKESAALDAARPQFRGDPTSAATLAAAETRGLETDFERTLDDIKERKIESLQTGLQQIVFNLQFNDAVVGNDGVKQITEAVQAALNRASTLKAVAGT